MIAKAARPETVSLAVEDPRAADSVALFDEMSVFVEATYPEDAENGIVPTTTDELAAHGLLVIARVAETSRGSLSSSGLPPPRPPMPRPLHSRSSRATSSTPARTIRPSVVSPFPARLRP